MRLARPVYESMPAVYAGVGAIAFATAYVDPDGKATVVAVFIGLISEVAALTVFLRRQDFRDSRREYTGEAIGLPSKPRRKL